MEQRVSVRLEKGRRIAVIVAGLTRGTQRLRSVEPPADRVLEQRSSWVVEWPAAEQPRRARLVYDVWGAPMVIARVETYTPGEFRALESVPEATLPEPLQKWRRAATEAASDHRTARAFFNELDERTEAWSEERDDLQALLRAFYCARWSGVDDPTALSTPSARILSTLEATAQMFTELFEAFADVEEIRDAFDLFARGELSLLGSTVPLPAQAKADAGHACQPDSTLHFLYAELAQACIQQAIPTTGGFKFPSPGIWADLLPTLVHSHRLFCRAYGAADLFDDRKPTEGILAPGRSLADVRTERAASVASIQAGVPASWAYQLRTFVTDVA